MKKIKKKKCEICKNLFKPRSSLQKYCSPECGYKLYIKNSNEKKEKEEKDWKVRKKKGLENIKTHSEHQKELQIIINNICRKIDYNQLCISCGGNGKKQAGHYHSVGANNSLRFNLHNIHIQDVHCNMHLSANIIGYNKGLIDTYGVHYKEFVEYDIKRDTPLVKLTKEELKSKKQLASAFLKSISEEYRDSYDRLFLRNEANKYLGINSIYNLNKINNMEKYGIEELKKATLAIAKLGNKIDENLEDDGKISFGEMIGSVPEVVALRKLFTKRKELKNEVLDLSDSEIEQIKEYVIEKLTLKEDIEEWIEWCIGTIQQLFKCPAFKKQK